MIVMCREHEALKWPCILKHSDDAELVFVNDQAEWDNDADLYRFEYDESDCLIDSSGNVHTLTNRINQHVRPEASGKSMSLEDILGLIKAHAALQGSCCVAKLYAPTISDAFEIVASLNETQ